MESHITKSQVEELLEKFISENPNADTFDLAEHFFNSGYEKAVSEGHANS